MTTAAPAADARLVVVLLALLAAAALVSYVGGLGVEREHVTAGLRAVLQLAAVAALLTVVMSSLAWSFAFVALMFAVASATSLRRLGAPARELPWVALPIAAGAAPVVALCLGSGVVPLSGTALIPVAGIIIGGAMTASTLSGRRAFDELTSQEGAYEAGLAIGLRSPEAAYLVLQPTAREALTPGLDQTRTVGLVTLPGAFVGVLLGGGSAVEAGAAQVLVLFGLMAAQSATSASLLRFIAHGHVVRRELRPRFPR